MPTPKYMNKVAIRLLPYRVTFYIIAAASAITVLLFILQMHFYKGLSNPDLNILLPVFTASILYLWSFGFILILSWFRKPYTSEETPTSRYLRFKLGFHKFSLWYATIFYLIYFCFSVVFTIISLTILLSTDF